MVDENFFVSAVSEVALLGIPEVCANVIGYIACLYVYYLFHDWLMRLEPREIDKTDTTIRRRDDKGEANLEFERATNSIFKFESGRQLEKDTVVGRCVVSVNPVRELRVCGNIRTILQ